MDMHSRFYLLGVLLLAFSVIRGYLALKEPQ